MKEIRMFILLATLTKASLVFKIQGTEDGSNIESFNPAETIFQTSRSSAFATSPISLFMAKGDKINDFPGSVISKYIASDFSREIINNYDGISEVTSRMGELEANFQSQLEKSKNSYFHELDESLKEVKSMFDSDFIGGNSLSLQSPVFLDGLKIFKSIDNNHYIEGVQNSDSLVVVLQQRISDENQTEDIRYHYAPIFLKTKSDQNGTVLGEFFKTKVSKGDLIIFASSQFLKFISLDILVYLINFIVSQFCTSDKDLQYRTNDFVFYYFHRLLFKRNEIRKSFYWRRYFRNKLHISSRDKENKDISLSPNSKDNVLVVNGLEIPLLNFSNLSEKIIDEKDIPKINLQVRDNISNNERPNYSVESGNNEIELEGNPDSLTEMRIIQNIVNSQTIPPINIVEPERSEGNSRPSHNTLSLEVGGLFSRDVSSHMRPSSYSNLQREVDQLFKEPRSNQDINEVRRSAVEAFSRILDSDQEGETLQERNKNFAKSTIIPRKSQTNTNFYLEKISESRINKPADSTTKFIENKWNLNRKLFENDLMILIGARKNENKGNIIHPKVSESLSMDFKLSKFQIKAFQEKFTSTRFSKILAGALIFLMRIDPNYPSPLFVEHFSNSEEPFDIRKNQEALDYTCIAGLVVEEKSVDDLIKKSKEAHRITIEVSKHGLKTSLAILFGLPLYLKSKQEQSVFDKLII
jgi:hypothetical protein